MNAVDRVIVDLMNENQDLKDRISDLELLLAEAHQTIEDVAIGTSMKCATCGNYHPCNCDK